MEPDRLPLARRGPRGKARRQRRPRAQFFNPLTNPPADDAQLAVISWNAFPRQVKSSSLSDKQRWRRADSDRNLQDEYCEWSVTRDPATRKITRVTFTCEGPEYWEVLASLNPDKVLALYREFVSPAVKREDLFANGRYNPLNRFNNSTTRRRDAPDPAREHAGRGDRARRGGDDPARPQRPELTGAQELILCSALRRARPQ